MNVKPLKVIERQVKLKLKHQLPVKMLQRMSYNQVSLSLLKYYFSIILFLSFTPAFDFFDVCESKSLTCQCGDANSSYPLHLVIKQCPRIYQWTPYCGDCKDEPSDDQRCAIYRNCLECEPDLNKCLKCPAGKYGKWCTGECQICANGGSCHRETGICQCPEGFFGSTCQNNLGCQPPASHINGGKVVGWTTKYATGTTITYECNNGYEMEGQPTLYCLENGLWSHEPPNCLVTKATIPDSPVKKDEPDKIIRICKPRSLTCHCGRKLSEVIHQVKQCEITVANEKKCGNCKDEPTDDEQCALYRNCDKCETNLNQCQDCVPGKFGKWCNETEVRYCPVIKITHDDKLSVTHNPPQPLTDEPKKSSKSTVPRIRIAKGPRLSNSRSLQVKARSALPKLFVDVATKAEFSCNSAFYELDKPTLSLCLPSGEWSKQSPSCIPKCGISGTDANPRIHYGKQSYYGQWPWQVALSQLNAASGKWQVYCGGTVISDSLVLTAAHCVTVKRSKTIMPSYTINLHFAKHHRNDTADRHTFSRSVEKIYTHPHYNPVTLDSDIALIRIKPISFMYYVQPVCLPNDQYGDEGLEQGNEGIVIGWGMMEDNNTSKILRQVKLPIVPNHICQTDYKSMEITNNMLCAGHKYGKYASCKGDSGGPLLFQKYPETNKWVQEGIVSFASPDGCGKDKQYSVFTRVRRFIDWINWVKQFN